MKEYTAQDAINDGLSLIKKNITGDLDKIVSNIIDRVRENPRRLELDITDIIPARHPYAKRVYSDQHKYMYGSCLEWELGSMSDSHFYIAEKLIGLGFDIHYTPSGLLNKEKTVISWFKSLKNEE